MATARATRSELEIGMADRLNTRDLANHLTIPVLPLSDLRTRSSGAVDYLYGVEPAAFSAATIFLGTRRIIVHNDAHSRGRQASDIAHECAHALLGHEPTQAFDESGCRLWDMTREREADWLAGVLLRPEEATLAIVRLGRTVESAANLYGVSRSMVQWRLNVTAAYRRIKRGKAHLRG